MHADVHKCAEVDDVAHRAGEHHAGFQVLHAHHIAAQLGLGQAVAHIAAGLAQFGNNVQQRGFANFQRLAQRFALPLHLFRQARQGRGADVGGGVAAGLQQGLGGRVALRVDGGGVQTVLRLRQAQESGTLFKGLGAEALHLFQLGAGGEGALLLPAGHDVFGGGFGDARHTGQQRRGGGVQVHAH